jgi:hypothetical protein
MLASVTHIHMISVSLTKRVFWVTVEGSLKLSISLLGCSVAL